MTFEQDSASVRRSQTRRLNRAEVSGNDGYDQGSKSNFEMGEVSVQNSKSPFVMKFCLTFKFFFQY